MRKHSQEFYDKKYAEMQRYAEDKGITFPFRNERQFISKWEEYKIDGVKNIDKTMKYDMQYETSYKTALSLYQEAKEHGFEDIKLKDVKKLSTYDFLKEHPEIADRLDEIYHEQAAKIGPEGAASFISTYWFGSV